MITSLALLVITQTVEIPQQPDPYMMAQAFYEQAVIWEGEAKKERLWRREAEKQLEVCKEDKKKLAAGIKIIEKTPEWVWPALSVSIGAAVAGVLVAIAQ